MFIEVSVFNMKEHTCARVLLADDHPVVAEDLRTVLEAEFDVIATVGVCDRTQRLSDGAESPRYRCIGLRAEAHGG